MNRTLRHDRGLVTGAVERLDTGWIRTTGRVTRAGIFQYLQPDGSIRRELRRPEEVFKEDSLASLRLVPLTLGHHGLIDSKNIGTLGVGNLGDSVRVEAPYIEVPLMVQREDAISAVDSGVAELSCTYEADDDPTPGVFEGEPYDIEQKNIRYNSVAIVPRGRAGAGARIRLDGAEQIDPSEGIRSKRPVQGQSRQDASGGTVKIRVKRFKADGSDDGMETIEVDEANVGSIEQLAARCEAMAATIRELQGQIAALKPKADTAETAKVAAEARADSAERELKKREDAADPKVLAGLVKERGALLARGIAVLGEEVAKTLKLDEMEPLGIKREVLKKLVPDMPADKLKQDGYAEAAFDIEMARFEKANAPLAATRLLLEHGRREDTADGPDPLAAYQKMQDEHAKLGK